MMIYGCWDDHLGDVWAFTSWCIKRDISVVSTTTETGKNIRGKLEEIMPLFLAKCPFELVDEPATDFVSQWDAWNDRYMTAVRRWENPGKIITYQFDGRLHADKKVPPEEDLLEIKAAMSSSTLRVEKLGGDKTLEDCVNLLAESVVFVGVDSGFSHLAHSVGVPIILIEHELDITPYHRGNPYRKTNSVEETVEAIREFYPAPI